MGFAVDRRALNITLLVMAFFVTCFAICSWILSHLANVGIIVVMTGLLLPTYVLAGFWVVNRASTPLSLGASIGSAAVLGCISMQWAIYFGELSSCQSKYDTADISVDHYSCSHKGAMRAQCFFGSACCLILLVFSVMLAAAKDVLLEDVASSYHDMGRDERTSTEPGSAGDLAGYSGYDPPGSLSGGDGGGGGSGGGNSTDL